MFDMLPAAIIRHPRISAAIGSVLLVVAIGFIWWQFIWQQPQRVFTDMLANNLTASSVTKVAGVSANTQSVQQNVRLQMGSVNASDWLVSATQINSSVTTESIGTPTTGYIRYLHIMTKLQGTGNKPFDFASILHTWGKSDGKTDTTLDHLFSQTLLDISSAPLPPIANLPQSERQNILAYIQSEHVFSPSYSTMKRQAINGRDVYTYTVAVQLGAYIRMMQAFAHDLGMTDLDTIDPSQYSTLPPITLSMSVDRTSHQLVRVTYPGSSFSQSYTSWGLLPSIQIPAKSITTTALQNRIQSLSTNTHP